MKKKRLILLFTIILAILMTACNKKSENAPAGNNNSDYVSEPDSTDSDSQGDHASSAPDSSTDRTDTEKPTGDTGAASGGLQEDAAVTPSVGTADKDGKTDSVNGQAKDTTADAAGVLEDPSDTAATDIPAKNSPAPAVNETTDTSNVGSSDEEIGDNQTPASAPEPADDASQEHDDAANDTTAQDNAAATQKPMLDFMLISKDNVPEYYITVEEAKPVESLNLDMSAKWLPVSQDYPISIETSLSQSSLPADIMNVGNYEEEKQDVFRYTYDCVNGCWRFTETAQRGFYFYSVHDMSDAENRSDWPRMRRCYYSDGSFHTEYLETDDWFYAPYEDEEGNIYAECGKYILGGMSENPDIYISKMDQTGKTLANIRISDLQAEDLTYLGFAYIKKDTVAIIYSQTLENTKQGTQLQIIDLKAKKMTAILHLEDEITLKVKSDGNYFVLTSASYQKVYVFDINTYELKNTVDTTKCKELCVYEWRANDFESGKYSNLSYNVDIKDGKLYFLRHSGIYVTDCLKSEFSKLLDGLSFADFLRQQYVYTSFFVGKDEDFYLLGVYVDEESATKLWHYTKKEQLTLQQ